MRQQESIEYARGNGGMRESGKKESMPVRENERKRHREKEKGESVRRYPILARPPAPTTPLPIFFQGVSHASSI